ncbi:hypothetical protein CWN68_25775 [Klebsiella michiganensis]|nr:hypothetical protein CWN68_25775 [Klebsiella michiganensis]
MAEAANTDGEISAAANAAESVRSVVFMSILLFFVLRSHNRCYKIPKPKYRQLNDRYIVINCK